MSEIRVPGYDISLDLDAIQKVEIRRDGDQTVVELVLHKEKSPRRYVFDSHEDGIEFYTAVWKLRQQTVDTVNAEIAS
jgi:hypothetical protein